MWEVGDMVVHPRYGPAVIEKMRTMQYQGETKHYYCLRLTSDNNKSVVMIPEDAIETIGLRSELLTAKMIRTIMHQPPARLDENTQLRQKHIKTVIESNNPVELIGLLRDICCLEQERRLSQTDAKSRKDLLAILEGELAFSQNINATTARDVLTEIIETAMEEHPADEDDINLR